MRILVLTNHYPPHAYGGYELCCRDVVDGLTARGHDVAVLTSNHRVAGVATPAPGSATTVQRTLPLTWDHGVAPPRWRRAAVEREARRTLTTAVASHRPDVVSVWNLSGLPGALATTVATSDPAAVWVFADAWPERVLTGDPWLGPLARHPWVGRIISRTGLPSTLADVGRSGTLCFCSAHLRQRIASATGWSMARSAITPLGVDRRDFPGPSAARRPDWSGRLLYVGRLDASKGIDTLLRALPLLPAAQLRVVGPAEPVHLERLRALTSALGVGERVTFGSCSRHELPAVYEAADVCVFPSEWDEPFGIVPLESMACGTPVVATGRGGSGEFLTDGQNCARFDAGDAEALAAAVRRVAADAGFRQRLVKGGLTTAGTLTVERLTDQLEEIHATAAVRAAGSGT